MRTKGFAVLAVVLLLLLSVSCSDTVTTVSSPYDWPVIRSYDKDHLCLIALPLGGMGTGTVSLAGNGELRDWNVTERYYNGSVTTGIPADATFFLIYARTVGSEAVVKALAGPACEDDGRNTGGRTDPLNGIPRFASASFDAAFPFGQVHLSDSEMPVDVTIKAFNPLVPGAPEVSGLPVAVLYFEVKNNTINDVIVSVCGTMRNFLGDDGGEPELNLNGRYGSESRSNLINVDGSEPGLNLTGRDRSEPELNLNGKGKPAGSRQTKNDYIFYRDIKGLYISSVSGEKDGPARGTMALSTAGEDTVSWRTGSAMADLPSAIKDIMDDFSSDGELAGPHLTQDGQPLASLAIKDTIGPGQSRYFRFVISWHFPERADPRGEGNAGNFYTADFNNAWDVAKKIIPYIPLLEANTLMFVRTLIETDLPQPVLEAALFNLSGLRSQSLFRSADGKMHGWESFLNETDYCQNSCVSGWNYEQATPFLFGGLARTMREIEFNGISNSVNGLAGSGSGVPQYSASVRQGADIENQMVVVMKFYREWQLSGDSLFLAEHWNRVKSVLFSAWTADGWDHDRDGVMMGAGNNRTDGSTLLPGLEIQIWYLGALRAANEMAKAMNDPEFGRLTEDLFRRGSEWTDNNMFKRQHGRSFTADQLAGQLMADICGLGYLVSRDNVIKTLARKAGTTSGHEYVASSLMFFEGRYKVGVKTIAKTRTRYDGLRGNPFSEADCLCQRAGSMAAWAPVIAITRFNYSAVDESFQIRSSEGVTFWSNGYSWGECVVTGGKGVKEVKLKVYGGELLLRKIILDGFGERVISANAVVINSGEESTFSVITSEKVKQY